MTSNINMVKKSNKLKILTFLFLTIFFLAEIFQSNYQNVDNNALNPNETLDTEIEDELSSSALPPIFYVNGTEEWEDRKDEGKCTGSGTESNPYVIRNQVFDGLNQKTCILIENSRANFTIENCTFINIGSPNSGKAGIELINTTHGILIDNNCTTNNNGNYGIHLRTESNNNTIIGNTLNGFGSGEDVVGCGLYLYNSSYNIITQNTLYYNENGIYLEQSEHNAISENDACNNTFAGIDLDAGSNDNNITRNIVNDNNVIGIHLSNSDANNFENNTMIRNRFGLYLEFSNDNTFTGENNISFSLIDGIYLSVSSNNSFTENIISYNNEIGVNLIGIGGQCVNNSFYKNFFRNNGKHAVDNNFLKNDWYINNSLKIGNFWDNYTDMGAGADDTNDDAIGDIPYFFLGGIDWFPIWNDGIEGDVIVVNGSSNLYNWTRAKKKFWCNGFGTPNNPYVIQPNPTLLWDGLIDGLGSLSSITIINSTTEYFKIKDLTLTNSGGTEAGIKLINVTRGELVDNNCSFNQGNGIYLSESSNINITGNLVNNNTEKGLFLDTNSTGNIIFENEMAGNKFGLYLDNDADGNNVSFNTLSYNKQYGIRVNNADCNNSIFYENN